MGAWGYALSGAQGQRALVRSEAQGIFSVQYVQDAQLSQRDSAAL